MDARDKEPNGGHLKLAEMEAYSNAIDMINAADCLIIGGTSLEVGSAAQLAHMYHGEHLIIINKRKTRMEWYATRQEDSEILKSSFPPVE